MANVPISAFTVPANTVGIGATGYSLTGSASASFMDLAGTWNTSGTPTLIKANVTDTASNANSLLMDFQLGSVSRARLAKTFDFTLVGVSGSNSNFIAINDGGVSSSLSTGRSGFAPYSGKTLIANSANNPVIINTSGGLDSNGPISLNVNSGGAVGDVILTRRAAANLRLGAADAAAPVAQTLSVQSVVAGTTNTAGTNLTITGSQGTGTGAGGSIVFQVAPAGGSGTAQNALATALTIGSDRVATFASNVALGNQLSLTGTTITGGRITHSAFGMGYTWSNNAGMGVDGDGRLYFALRPDIQTIGIGGVNSASFPALKRSSTTLQVRLADDSAFAGFASANMQAATAYTVSTLPTPATGMIARVTDATAPTIGTTVVGGGAAYALVNYNGANWTVIGV